MGKINYSGKSLLSTADIKSEIEKEIEFRVNFLKNEAEEFAKDMKWDLKEEDVKKFIRERIKRGIDRDIEWVSWNGKLEGIKIGEQEVKKVIGIFKRKIEKQVNDCSAVSWKQDWLDCLKQLELELAK